MTRYVREDVAHVWAHQLQTQARSKTGRLYFEGATIFSYGSHFPIARHVERKGNRCVLFTTRTYSHTTARHICEVRRAIPPGVPVFHVSDVTGRNMLDCASDYANRITAKIEEAAKARQRRPYLLSEAQALVAEARAFCSFFGIRRKFKDVGNIDEIKAELDAIKKRKAAQEAKQKREQAKKDAERLEKWLAGEYVGHLNLGTDYMRINDDQVETTKNAIVPLKDVKKVAKLVLRHVKSSKHWQKNGGHIKVGDYELDAITSDGTVIVGCHRFARSEIERFAAVLGIK